MSFLLTEKKNVFDLLPLIVLLLFLIYFSEVASAQEQIRIQNNSAVGDEQSQDQTIPWIGLDRTLNLTREIANELGLKEPIGVLVLKVFPKSPAQEAGIMEGNTWTNIEGIDVKLGGDVILKADNQTITDSYRFERLLQDKEIGDNLRLTTFRDGQIREINVTVSSKPGPLYESASNYANPANVDFSSYENTELGIGIDYPSNWEVEDYERPDTINFRSLPEHSDDSARDYLRIDVVQGYGFERA